MNFGRPDTDSSDWHVIDYCPGSLPHKWRYKLQVDFDSALIEIQKDIPWLTENGRHTGIRFNRDSKHNGIPGICIVEAPDTETLEEARVNLSTTLRTRLKSLMGRDVEIVFQIDEDHRQSRYMAGSWNESAYRAVQKLFEGDLHNNPLYIHGIPGSGKTYLLKEAISQHNPENQSRPIQIYQAEELKYLLMESLAEKKREDFRNEIRNNEIFILEDIQSLGRWSVSTQEEFYYIFNHYYDNDRPIIITADRSIRDLEIFPSLKSRLTAGLSVSLREPDRAFRKKYLKAKCKEHHIECSGPLLDLITERARGTIRELESVINRLYFIQSYVNMEDHELIWKELKEFYSESAGFHVDPDVIIQVICSKFQITVEDLLGPSRRSEITRPRHIAMYLATRFTDLSKSAVARFFKRTDHTTVINAERKVSKLMETDMSYRLTVENLVNELRKDRE